ATGHKSSMKSAGENMRQRGRSSRRLTQSEKTARSESKARVNFVSDKSTKSTISANSQTQERRGDESASRVTEMMRNSYRLSAMKMGAMAKKPIRLTTGRTRPGRRIHSATKAAARTVFMTTSQANPSQKTSGS